MYQTHPRGPPMKKVEHRWYKQSMNFYFKRIYNIIIINYNNYYFNCECDVNKGGIKVSLIRL